MCKLILKLYIMKLFLLRFAGFFIIFLSIELFGDTDFIIEKAIQVIMVTIGVFIVSITTNKLIED